MVFRDVDTLYEHCATMEALVVLYGKVQDAIDAMSKDATSTEIGKRVQALIKKRVERLEDRTKGSDERKGEEEDTDDEFELSPWHRDRAEVRALRVLERELSREYGFGGECEVDLEREEAIRKILDKIEEAHGNEHEAGYYIDRHFDELLSMVPARIRGETDRRDAREMRAARRQFADARHF